MTPRTASGRCLAIATAMAAVVTLTGCGQTGPLFLPEDVPVPADDTTATETDGESPDEETAR